MPRLANERHELFAQNLARGLSQTDAYVAAGFSQNRGNAARLNADDSICARVAELQERAATNVMIRREWVIEQLVDNVKAAKLAGEIAPANRALELLGKEIGMFVERAENTNLNYVISDEPPTEDEWVASHAIAH